MKIVHVFRAPIGGLFRHVRDLAKGQSERGHSVGIICDSTTGGDYADRLLNELKDVCTLGVERRPISRMPGLGDLAGARAAFEISKVWQPDVLHGHGAKGGAYARLAAKWLGKRSFYTPHGGTLHQPASLPMRMLFTAAERYLRRIGTGLTFVCDYERNLFDKKIGIKGAPYTVVHNGLWKEEYVSTVPLPDATDFVFVGEMRDYKGVDILLEALAKLPGKSLTLVGDGPSMDDYKALADRLGISSLVRFMGRKPFTEATHMGRIMVLPSRFESFPYVVLETAASGLPLITSAVGGIAEVVPRSMLCEPLTAAELARRMGNLLADPSAMAAEGKAYADHIRKTCDADDMVDKITAFYSAAGRG